MEHVYRHKWLVFGVQILHGSKDLAWALTREWALSIHLGAYYLGVGAWPEHHVISYSRASDNRPSEKRTTSLQRTSAVLPIEFSIVIVP